MSYTGSECMQDLIGLLRKRVTLLLSFIENNVITGRQATNFNYEKLHYTNHFYSILLLR